MHTNIYTHEEHLKRKEIKAMKTEKVNTVKPALATTWTKQPPAICDGTRVRLM